MVMEGRKGVWGSVMLMTEVYKCLERCDNCQEV